MLIVGKLKKISVLLLASGHKTVNFINESFFTISSIKLFYSIQQYGGFKMSLEIIAKQGRLVDVFPLFERSTLQHSDEIQADRFAEIASKKDDAVLRNQWFWTADFPMYTMEGKEVVLYMAREKDNLAFNNIVDATTQIREKNNYFINDRQGIDSVINSDTTLKVVLSDLKLKSDNAEWRYFEIDTKKYDKLNESQKALAERIHGKGQAFKDSMEMLNKAGIKTTNVYVLNPEYVKENVPENGAIARVSVLNYFNGNSYFFALSGNVVNDGRRLRGVLLTSEAGAQKVYTIDQVLEEKSRTNDFAPTQIRLLKNILENGYKIIKG
ncbi:MAG: hypothetical protein KKF95_02020 [Nanoarchaeota archaeon]|nr:hypothetical protein [Nanoarchaeota archaeon]MBU2442819.1 hypothetical protein [Nanoarchaeota archaeon]